MTTLLAFFTALVLPDPVAAQDRDGRYVVRTAQAPVAVDGVIDEPVWAQAESIALPYEVQPGANTPAPVRTDCRVAFDQTNLYVACRAEDPDPSGIRAFLTDRDDLADQDRILITLDPFQDGRRGVRFGVSALGVQSDAVVIPGGSGGETTVPLDPSWDAIWASAGRITDSGYTVEIAIPFKSLRFPDTDVQEWSLQISRWWPRTRDVEMRNVAWDRADACYLCQAVTLSGVRGVQPGRNVQVTPTVTASRQDLATTPGMLTPGSIEPRLGVTGLWGVTPGLTMGVTVRPDFSHVEADAALLDVNTTFALFFPEKRPFFLEGTDIFATPERAVFTRSVVEPNAGVKLTGKVGPYAVGFMAAQDDVANVLVPGAFSSRTVQLNGPMETFAVRIRRDLGRSSTVGVLFTDREGTDYWNRVAAVDGLFRPLPPLTLQFQVLGSSTRDPAAVRPPGAPDESVEDVNVQGRILYETRNWILQSSFGTRGPQFRADAGFLPQTNSYGGFGRIARRIWSRGQSWFTRWSFELRGWNSRTHDDELIERGVTPVIRYDGPGQTFVQVFPRSFMQRRFAGTTHDMQATTVEVGTRPSAAIGVSATLRAGEAIDFANARKAGSLRFGPGVDLRLGRRVDLRADHQFERLRTGGQRILRADITQLRAVYNFSIRSFARVVTQHRLTRRNPALYSSPVANARRSLFVQFLLSYKVNPETVVFLGFEDRQSAEQVMMGDVWPLRAVGRTFFAKVSYAWRP